MLNTIIKGDCLEVLPTIQTESIHLILSDIPYGIGIEEWDVLHDNTNKGYLEENKDNKIFKKRGKPLNGWSKADKLIPIQYQEWCMKWAKEWFRVLKTGGSAIVFAGRRLMHRCILALEEVGFIYKDMLSWEKGVTLYKSQSVSKILERRGDKKNAKKWEGWKVGNLRPSFEPVLWFMKPYKIGSTLIDTIINNEVGAYNNIAFMKYTNRLDNIIKINKDKGDDTGLHPTQKPLRLMQSLIELTTIKKQVVLDPFCGSGTTCLAAAILDRNYIGIEKDYRYFDIASKRLSSYQKSLDLG
jgi:site-specific DNA-methyltransferase (adenine-specific)